MSIVRCGHSEKMRESLTIAVDVLVAGVSLAIAVGVPLLAVGDVGTVVAGVAE